MQESTIRRTVDFRTPTFTSRVGELAPKTINFTKFQNISARKDVFLARFLRNFQDLKAIPCPVDVSNLVAFAQEILELRDVRLTPGILSPKFSAPPIGEIIRKF